MSEIDTPGDVLAELNRIREQSERGIQILADAENKYVALSLEAQKQEALAFLGAGGTVKDREALARIDALPFIEAAELAKVEVNRIKAKLKHLSEAQMAVQTSARMVELHWRTGK